MKLTATIPTRRASRTIPIILILILPRIFILGAASLEGLTLTSCASQQFPGRVEAMEVKVDRVMPENKSLDASAISVTLSIYNPRPDPVKIEGIEYSIDTKEVGGVIEGSSGSGGIIEGSQTAEITFEETIPFPEGKEEYQSVIGRGAIPVELHGTVTLSDGSRLPFEKVTEVATPTLPQFIVYDSQAARYGNDGVDVTLFLRLINDNVFPVTIEGVRYTVFIDDKKVKSEQAGLGVRLIQGAAEEYEVGTVLDSGTFDKSQIQRILADRKVSYKVTGKIDISRLAIPFEYAGEIELGTGE